ncbi:hypothetical protein NM688_g9288 [Phlebia brevispora]|uniref:Uncharacterized protein n=1 Tax=Phlebia brevispora TaxID=194682 RepID=A0ACC1RJX8_9APHY|nr:hypothetical protein NM688_g9288 [Phlebia brevispora]
MQRTHPLQDHPEFSVRRYPGCVEYRVENWRIARDGTRRVLRGYGWSWFDAVVPVLAAVYWHKICASQYHLAAFGIALAIYVYFKCTQVLWESVLAIPSLGLQLETHRGLPNIPLFVSRRFIPLIYLQDFIINEGLHRWNVRYYLAAIQNTATEGFALKVAYENILPYFPVLLEVYRGVYDALLDNEDDRGDQQPT